MFAGRARAFAKSDGLGAGIFLETRIWKAETLKWDMDNGRQTKADIQHPTSNAEHRIGRRKGLAGQDV
jgi:hypothetical protein